MFYSHSLLSRKSQLGTVWMAAYQQSRLQKSHVIVTDISHTVEQIMFPKAPLALRLSGNLLLGVTRIYSKKVDYLHDDWNKFFSQVIIKLKPVNTSITFQAVTLPDTFELDAMDFGETVNLMESSDSHKKTLDDNTLSEDNIVDEDMYISFHVPGAG
ncbi:Double-strand-break repair protein rad21-like protein [Zostera marina]|uniref:Double-strand-break repair protein rad21-like protein n=1 Tax=Zostera marina TaxID=29655 RepID=A0A0K9PJ72_ZOSMR|nr:Double-strand-break repair protein rad21-like protein [Zostera marina]